jgi:hypothetical protein
MVDRAQEGKSMQRKLGFWLAGFVLLSLASAQGAGKAVVAGKSDLKWVDMGIPGVTAATVEGDMKKGGEPLLPQVPGGARHPGPPPLP